MVFLVALPLCLGIALASHAPLASGILAGIIGGIVVGFLSDSPLSVSGPAAGLTVIVASAVMEMGGFEVFTLSVLLAGLLQVCLSFLKAGKIGNYFPTSVIKGMLAAIGLILILKQIPPAVGYDADFFGDESFFQMDGHNTFSEINLALGSLHLGASLIAFISLGIIVFWERLTLKSQKDFYQFIPAPLMAVIVSVLLNEIFKRTCSSLLIDGKHLVQLPFEGGFLDVFKNLSFPNFSHLQNPLVYSTAVVMAIIASLESLLSVEASDKIDQEG